MSWKRREVLGGAGALGAGLCAAGLAVLGSKDGGAIVSGKSRAARVNSAAAFPKSADVVVVGAGYVGTQTAMNLTERGLNVVLCEKGVVAGEASGRSFGYIDSQLLHPDKLSLIARSKYLWEKMDARVGAHTGYRRAGLATVFSSDEGVEGAQQWLMAVSKAPGIDARILAPTDARNLFPGMQGPVAGALFQPSDAIAEPQLASPAFARHFIELGGTLLQGCAVRGLELAGGRVAGVVTEKGSIRCRTVVLAGGAWSSLFARNLDLELIQLNSFATSLRLAPATPLLVSLISESFGIAFRKVVDGSIDICRAVGAVPITPSALTNIFKLKPALDHMGSQVDPVFNLDTFLADLCTPSHWAMNEKSPFESNRILMPEVRQSLVRAVLSQANKAFPELASVPIRETWAGVLTTTLDNMPYISEIASIPGLLVGSGFSYGLTMGPAAGEALADIITGKSPQFDLKPFRFDRFIDGSPIIFRE